MPKLYGKRNLKEKFSNLANLMFTMLHEQAGGYASNSGERNRWWFSDGGGVLPSSVESSWWKAVEYLARHSCHYEAQVRVAQRGDAAAAAAAAAAATAAAKTAVAVRSVAMVAAWRRSTEAAA